MEGPARKIPSENPASYCRLCFVEKNLIPLFSCDDGTKHLLVEQIAQFIGIYLEPAVDGFGSICWRCAVTLEDFYLLRQRSLEHDEIIRNTRQGHAFEIVHFKDAPNGPELLVESQLLPIEATSTFCENSGDDTKDPVVDLYSDINEKSYGGAAPDDKLTCKLCSTEFKTRSGLYNHCKEQHSDGARQFKCTFCTADFKRKGQLERHLESHTGIRRYACNSCDVSYAKAKALENHMKRKHENVPYSTKKPALQRGLIKCPFCTENFGCEKSLDTHLKTHSDMLPHVCEFCDARFAYALGLSVHKARYHPDAPKQPNSANIMVPRFPCDYCPRYFEIRSNLKEHLEAVHKIMLPDLEQNEPNGEKTTEELPQNNEILKLEFKTEIEDYHMQEDHLNE